MSVPVEVSAVLVAVDRTPVPFSESHVVSIVIPLEAVVSKKGKHGKKGKARHKPKAPNQAAQHVKTIEMQKESLAKKDAEIAQLLARLGGGAPPSEEAIQEQAPAPTTKATPKKETKSPAQQRPASPETAEAGSPLKRPPSLHVMARRASALSPGRSRSFGGSPD